MDAANAAAKKSEAKAAETELAAEDKRRTSMSKSTFGSESQTAPRSANGELAVRRREIHSGRSLSVSAVEWSVAEKMAKPTSALEGYMWEKETQVDRLRERISLALLMSQCKAAMVDPAKPKPRDWISPVKQAGAEGKFVIIPVRFIYACNDIGYVCWMLTMPRLHCYRSAKEWSRLLAAYANDTTFQSL